MYWYFSELMVSVSQTIRYFVHDIQWNNLNPLYSCCESTGTCSYRCLELCSVTLHLSSSFLPQMKLVISSPCVQHLDNDRGRECPWLQLHRHGFVEACSCCTTSSRLAGQIHNKTDLFPVKTWFYFRWHIFYISFCSCVTYLIQLISLQLTLKGLLSGFSCLKVIADLEWVPHENAAVHNSFWFFLSCKDQMSHSPG